MRAEVSTPVVAAPRKMKSTKKAKKWRAGLVGEVAVTRIRQRATKKKTYQEMVQRLRIPAGFSQKLNRKGGLAPKEVASRAPGVA